MEPCTLMPERVQNLASRGDGTIPSDYVRPEYERTSLGDAFDEANKAEDGPQVPIVDISRFLSSDETNRLACVEEVKKAAIDWGVMHVVNHGIPLELLDRVRAAGKAFFELPVEDKEMYANDPNSGNISGYGSKLANSSSGKLEWEDYFFHLIFPKDKVDLSGWPRHPADYRYVYLSLRLNCILLYMRIYAIFFALVAPGR